jgi:hypothetical protein
MKKMSSSKLERPRDISLVCRGPGGYDADDLAAQRQDMEHKICVAGLGVRNLPFLTVGLTASPERIALRQDA